MKRVLTFLIALAIIFVIPLTAYGHDVPQDRSDCSIEVIVRYDGKDINGGTLTAIKVGYVDEDDGNYFFSQEITGELLAEIDTAEAVEALKDFYNENKETYTFFTQTQSVKDGKAVFTDLPTGLYLVIQERAAYGYSRLSSFLVSVPYMQDGEYQYHVSAASKPGLETEVSSTPSYSNEPPPPPQTGQLNWPVPLMTVSGLAIFIVGWVLYNGKKRDQYAE